MSVEPENSNTDPSEVENSESGETLDNGNSQESVAAAAGDIPPPVHIPEPALEEVMDEFDEADFDHDFDDDFEEEIEGEYDLQDDQYGQEFNDQFGHLTPDADKDEKKK